MKKTHNKIDTIYQSVRQNTEVCSSLEISNVQQGVISECSREKSVQKDTEDSTQTKEITKTKSSVKTFGNELFACKNCTLTFTVQTDFNNHKKSFHKIVEDKDLNSEECVQTQASEPVVINFAKEVIVIENKQTFEKKENAEPNCKCNICEKAFDSTSNLETHINELHLSKRKFKAICEFCKCPYIVVNGKDNHFLVCANLKRLPISIRRNP